MALHSYTISFGIYAAYAEILMQRTFYLDKKYGTRCFIVFGGCKPGTKDLERQRRCTQDSIAMKVVFQLQNEVQCKQLEFLANSNDKL